MTEKLYFELPTDTEGMDLPENLPSNYEVEVDVYKGNKNMAVVIIVGKGGTTEGFDNKYVTIANKLAKDHGVSVFVIENPGISWDNPELYVQCAMNFVDNKMIEFGYSEYRIYAMGYSAGGHFIGRFASKYPVIKQILLVNPVLRVNFTKLKNALNEFRGKIRIVQGDKDPDFFYSPLLKQIPRAKVYVLGGVDHQFTNEGGLEMFTSLPEKHLFD